uniref:Trafficking protein particle complex subunit 5 n=1 Tax=Tetranychus urticae TaxID=32264 RepID=T1JUZ1_TETUR
MVGCPFGVTLFFMTNVDGPGAETCITEAASITSNIPSHVLTKLKSSGTYGLFCAGSVWFPTTFDIYSGEELQKRNEINKYINIQDFVANAFCKRYYIIESDPIVNKYISYNRDEGSLNCASFIGGIIAAALNETGFNAKVTVHWHKGTTFMINFDQATIDRDKAEERILIKNLSAKCNFFENKIHYEKLQSF